MNVGTPQRKLPVSTTMAPSAGRAPPSCGKGQCLSPSQFPQPDLVVLGLSGTPLPSQGQTKD